MSGFRVTQLHAFLSVGEDGEEGVPAFQLGGSWMPLVAADATRLEQLRPLAQRIADETGRELTLAKFTVRMNVETIKPAGR